jgi:protein-disulfide isomerase
MTNLSKTLPASLMALPLALLMALLIDTGLWAQAPGPAAGASSSASGAASGTSPKNALDKATLEAYLRHLFVWRDEIRVEVLDPKPAAQLPGFQEVRVRASLGDAGDEVVLLVSDDGRHILQGKVFDVAANPFQEDLDRLKTDSSPFMGTPGAPVALVMFGDFECGYCREEALMLRENLLKAYPTQVQLFYKDFPLTSIHPWAMPAATAGRCVHNNTPEKFWDFFYWMYDHQPEINPENLGAKLGEFAAAHGVDIAQLNECRESQGTLGEVAEQMNEARAMGLNSTPTIFINGRRIASAIPWPSLKQIIDSEIVYREAAQAAGEDCCSPGLTGPGNESKP